MRQPTILSHTSTTLKTARPLDFLDYVEGVVLKHWTHHGVDAIALDRDELLTLLRALPAALLVRALGSADPGKAEPPAVRGGACYATP